IQVRRAGSTAALSTPPLSVTVNPPPPPECTSLSMTSAGGAVIAGNVAQCSGACAIRYHSTCPSTNANLLYTDAGNDTSKPVTFDASGDTVVSYPASPSGNHFYTNIQVKRVGSSAPASNTLTVIVLQGSGGTGGAGGSGGTGGTGGSCTPSCSGKVCG